MIQNSSGNESSSGGGHSGAFVNNKMDIENMHPFCLPFSLCHDATSSSFIDDSTTTSAINSLEGNQIGPDETKFGTTSLILNGAQDEFDVFDLEIKIEDELNGHVGDHNNDDDHDEFRLRFGDKRQDEVDWFLHMPEDHSHLLSPPAPISTSDTKSSPTLAQLNLNSSDDPVDSLWDSTTGGATLGRSNTPRSSATTTTTTSSTLISPSVQRHRSIQNQHHHLSTLSPVSSDLLSSQSPSHTFTHLYHQHHQRQPNTHHQGHPHQFHPEPHQFQAAAAAAAGATLARPILQRCQSPAPLVTSSCSPLSTTGAAHESNNNNGNKLKENIDYLTVLLCNGSKKLDTKSASNQQHQPQQSGISSSMAKSYSVLTQSLSTGPKLLERYQMDTPQATGNFEKVDSSVSAADSTGAENHHHHNNNNNNNQQQQQQQQQQQHSHLNQHHQLNANQTASQQQANYSNFCYANTTTTSTTTPTPATTSSQQQLEARANEMKVLSSLLSSGKTLAAGQMYGQTPMMSSAIIEQSAAGAASCASWPQPSPAFHHAIGSQQVPMRPTIEGGPYQAREPASAAGCRGQQSPQQVYAQQQVSSSIPINGRPITLTPLVSNNVNIGSRPTPLASAAPTLAAKGRSSSSAAVAAAAGPNSFVQPNSPSTSSTTSSSDTSIQSTAAVAAAAVAANKRQKAAANHQMAPQTAAASKQAAGSDRTGRPSSMSTDGSLSSHDEGFSSQMDQDDCADSMRGDSDDDGSELDSDDESFYGDYTNNDLIGASISDNPECKWTLNMGRTRRNGQRRFFWQYNVQSKGPKGARVCSAEGGENPFVLPEASDPVFSDECQIEGVKHSGKARRGDGNDLTPNPRKLLMIGLELKKLSKIINELAPVTDLPVNARNKTRKEKNKLASRACRLKKKAQHEANKIKLYGLQREHQQVVMAIFDARKLIHKSLVSVGGNGSGGGGGGGHHVNNRLAATSGPDQRTGLGSNLRRLLEQCIVTVAGQTGDYVNSVLEKVVSGCIDGGLQT